MSTTIDSLDIQITTSAGRAEAKIDQLARALGKLKENGKITVATNGLKRLADALGQLNPALSGLHANKLHQLASAMNGLSGIQKLSGLNSAVNTLKKIPDVMNDLDDAKLEKFATQMKKLGDAIEPLVARIDKLGAGFSKLPAQVSKVVTATNRMEKSSRAAAKANDDLDTSAVNMMANFSNIGTVLGVIDRIATSMTKVMDEATQWEGIQFRFGRAFGEDAEEVLKYAQKVNDVLGINMQQFMQYSSLYGSLLSGFGLAQEKVTTISVGLTELSYDIWAAYNDRFKTLEDASEAVRSAITGEIEPIRNAGIALTEASLQEYLESVGMATVSIEKLSEAQKAEVRYAAMVDAAMNQGIVGTYAGEMTTAEGAIRNMTQSLKTLTQAFGSLFIPILQMVVPYLTAFVQLLTEAVHWVAGLFGVKLFEIDWGSSAGGMATGLEEVATGAEDVTDGLKKAGKAAKKLKDYTLGFDELNVISPPDPSSGGSGGGAGAGGVGDSGWGDGLDLDTLWDDSVFAKATKQIDEIRAKVKAWFDEWKTELGIIAGALGVLSMAALLKQMGEALQFGPKFSKMMGGIMKGASTVIVVTLQFSLMTEFFKSYIDGEGFEEYIKAMIVGAIGTGILYSMWGPAGLVIGLGVTAAASLKAVIDNGGITDTESAVVALTGFGSAIGAVVIGWKKLAPLIANSKFADTIRAIFDAFKGNGAAKSALTFMFPTLSKIGAAIGGAAKAVGTFVTGLTAPAWGVIVGVITAIVSVAKFLYENWDEVVRAVKDFFATNIAPKLQEIKDHFGAMKDALAPIAKKFQPLIDKAREFFEGIDWSGFLSWIGDLFEWLGGLIFGVVSGVIAGAFNWFIGIVENVVQMFRGAVEIISGIVDFWVSLFTGDLMGAWEAVKKIGAGIVEVFKGLWGLVVDPIKDFVGGIIDWFTELWDELVGHSIVPDMIDDIVEWFKSLPGKIFKPVQDFVDGILKKFRDMWTNLKSWWNRNVAPKLTLSYWKTQFSNITKGLGDKLDEAWKKVKDFFDASEWKKKVTDAVEAIKKNFKMPSLPKIKLSVTWDKNVGSVKKAVYEALGLDGWPSLKWSTYAQGGFPTMGEAFIARENGPELVGKIGNRTAVVNNDQIVDAVSRGVYSAVVAAMGANTGNGGQNVNVYLDGKQIYSRVKKIESERGVSVMGSQLGYAY